MSNFAKQRVMFVQAEFPGYATPLFAQMGRCLARRDVPSVYVCGSRHYERFRSTKLSDIGPAYYASDCLSDIAPPRSLPHDFDRFWLHATFMRQREHAGRHQNEWSDYARVWHWLDDVFERHPDIGAICSEFPTNSLISLAYAHAQRRNIDFLGFSAARVPGHFNVSRDEIGVDLIENPTPPTIGSHWTQSPDYMRLPMNAIARTSWQATLLPILLKLPTVRWVAGEHSIEMGTPICYQATTTLNRLKRKLKHSNSIRLGMFEQPEFDPGKRNILFPLQYRPEASTLVQARYWNDDYETLRNIAFSLPVNARLYVKEHPSAVGVRDHVFYERLRELPDVHVVAPEWPLLPNLRSFAAIVCLTSTAGFEALQHGVPVLLIGRTFYENYPGVTRIRSWDQLATALRNVALIADPAPRRDEILQRYARTCFPGNFAYMDESSLAVENVERLVQPLLATVRDARISAAD